MITEEDCNQMSLDLDVAAEVWLQHLNFTNMQPAKLHVMPVDNTLFVSTEDRNSVCLSFSLDQGIESWFPGVTTRPGGQIYLTIGQADALREQLSLIVDQAWTYDDEPAKENASPVQYHPCGRRISDLLGEIAHTFEFVHAESLFKLTTEQVRAAAIALRLAQEALENLRRGTA